MMLVDTVMVLAQKNRSRYEVTGDGSMDISSRSKPPVCCGEMDRFYLKSRPAVAAAGPQFYRGRLPNHPLCGGARADSPASKTPPGDGGDDAVGSAPAPVAEQVCLRCRGNWRQLGGMWEAGGQGGSLAGSALAVRGPVAFHRRKVATFAMPGGSQLRRLGGASPSPSCGKRTRVLPTMR